MGNIGKGHITENLKVKALVLGVFELMRFNWSAQDNRLDKQHFPHKMVNIFLPIILSICFESTHKNSFLLRNRKIIFLIHFLN